jgi:hypothetical protein
MRVRFASCHMPGNPVTARARQRARAGPHVARSPSIAQYGCATKNQNGTTADEKADLHDGSGDRCDRRASGTRIKLEKSHQIGATGSQGEKYSTRRRKNLHDRRGDKASTPSHSYAS